MERPAACRLCGASQDWQPIEAINNPVSALYHCRTCDGQFWWPVANPGADWYEETYAGRNQDPVQHLGWNHYQFLNESLPVRTLLDVGAGIGHLMAAARDRGWQVHGLDFDRDGIRAAQAQYGIMTIEPLSMEQYARQNPDTKFFVVSAFEVLEHMDDPRAFIREMAALVEPGGYVAISVPYRHAPAWLRPHDFPPRHLTRWNRTVMANFLTIHGLEPVHLRRGNVSLGVVLMRMRFSAGPLGHMNVVSKVRSKLVAQQGEKARTFKKLIWLRRAARLKDWVLFGVPATGYWLYLWLRRRQYTALYVLAQKR